MLRNLSFTLDALRNAYAQGIEPVAVIEEVYDRLELVQDLGIFIHLRDRAEMRAEAEALGPFDPQQPLWGIPFAVKDNIDVAGIQTTAGCPAYAYAPEADATVVANLRAAGALMVGKTNLDQFATGLVGVRTPYGAPLNAVDPELVPGGSSGGSGVIVGHGIVTFALGTDTAGSGRVPAAMNNIVGLKPTLGALSARGVVPACRTLDTVSVFALTVDDAYAAFAAARGYDAADPYSRPLTHRPLTALPRPVKIGIPNTGSIQFFGDAVQEAAFRRDIARLEAAGAQIVPLNFEPLFEIAKMLYQGAWVAERYTVIQDLLARNPDAIHPVTRQIIGVAEDMSAADAFRGIYRLAELKRKAQPMLESVDVLCVPTIPTLYTVADLEQDPIVPNANLGLYTNFVNLLDMCGIAVPTAPRSDGRPGSLTVLAKAEEDALVASLARTLECGCDRMLGATDHPLPLPAASNDQEPPGKASLTQAPLSQAPSEQTASKQAASDTIALAVCGAHMSDLPLNWQLTEPGGQFVRTAATAPVYRFYALTGGPPARPGLVRSADPSARSIMVEIWSLPKAALGDFVDRIPSPLGIGSIELSDGSWVKGFLCEASGTAGATEITHLADWRAFLASQNAPV